MPIRSKRIVCPIEARDEAMSQIVSKRVVDNQTGCWVCKSKPNERGYCAIRLLGTRAPWHRVCFAVANGECPQDSVIDHTCDNTRCGNPSHLIATTQQGNMQAMVRRGRHGSVRKPNSVCRGEENAAAKLTTRDVLEIWGLSDSGASTTFLANKFKIHRGHVRHLVRRRGFRHLLTEEERHRWPPKKPQKQKPLVRICQPVSNQSDRKRFESRVKKLENGCAILRKSNGDTSEGAKNFSVCRVSMSVSRAAWILKVGPIPQGLVVRHKCNRGSHRCCNVSHLELGTCRDNTLDMLTSDRSCAVFTGQEIVNIFEEYSSGLVSTSELARKHRVSKTTIKDILKRKTCAHVVIPDVLLEKVAKAKQRQTHLRGADTGRSKFSERQIREIHAMKAVGHRTGEIAKRYGVKPSRICNILAGRIWKHIYDQLSTPRTFI